MLTVKVCVKDCFTFVCYAKVEARVNGTYRVLRAYNVYRDPLGLSRKRTPPVNVKLSKPEETFAKSRARRILREEREMVMSKIFPKQACLSGEEIIALLEGEQVRAYGVNFVFDGTNLDRIREVADRVGEASRRPVIKHVINQQESR